MRRPEWGGRRPDQGLGSRKAAASGGAGGIRGEAPAEAAKVGEGPAAAVGQGRQWSERDAPDRGQDLAPASPPLIANSHLVSSVLSNLTKWTDGSSYPRFFQSAEKV